MSGKNGYPCPSLELMVKDGLIPTVRTKDEQKKARDGAKKGKLRRQARGKP